MTISITGPRFSYTGNGSTTVFSFPRQFFLDADLDVYLVDTASNASAVQVLNTDYTVTGAGSPSGGSITMLVAPPSGKTLVIVRDTAATQGLDLDSVTKFPMTSLESALDRAMMVIDEVATKISRAIMAPIQSVLGFDYSLPTPSASKFLGVNAAGTGFSFKSILAGTGMSASSDETAGTLTLNYVGLPGGGSGNVVGPGSSVNGNIPQFNGTTGRLLSDGGTTISALQNATQSGTGAVSRTIAAKVLETTVSVIDYGADPTGVADSSTAIQNAVNSVQTLGGTVFFPPGSYKISAPITIGNGSSGAYSTYAGVQLVGAGGGVFPGPSDRSSAKIVSSYAGPAIVINGPIGSWGVENLAISFTTTSTSARGLQVNSGIGGRVRNLEVTGCYGTSVYVTTVGSTYVSEHNKYENVFIYLPPSGAAAIGIYITGAGASGGSTGACFEEWHNTCIIITNAGQTGRIFQYCDNINFFNTQIKAGASGCAVLYDYSSTGTNGSSFPNDCRDFGLEVYSNTILNYSPSGIGSIATPNRIYGFSLTNGATQPNLSNLSVLNEAGTSKVVMYLASAQSIGNTSTKVALDTKAIDNDTIGDAVTNRRVTPKRAGYYQVEAQIMASSFAGASRLITTIQKNGATAVASAQVSNNGDLTTAKTSVLVFMNGKTDYIEMFGQITGGSTALTTGQTNTFMTVLGPF